MCSVASERNPAAQELRCPSSLWASGPASPAHPRGPASGLVRFLLADWEVRGLVRGTGSLGGGCHDRILGRPSAPVGDSTWREGRGRLAAGESDGHPHCETARGRVQTRGATVATSGSDDSGAGSRAPAAGLGECQGASGSGDAGQGRLGEVGGAAAGRAPLGRPPRLRTRPWPSPEVLRPSPQGQFILGLVLFAVFGPAWELESHRIVGLPILVELPPVVESLGLKSQPSATPWVGGKQLREEGSPPGHL